MRRAAIALCALALAVACGGGGRAARGTGTGLITGVDEAAKRIVVELGSQHVPDGEPLTKEPQTFDVEDASVPMTHLREHMEQRLPVRVTWRRNGDRLTAERVEDV